MTITKSPTADKRHEASFELRRVIDRAAVQFILGENRKGSALMWDAAARAVSLVAEQKGAPHATVEEMQSFVKKLSKEAEAPYLYDGFGAADFFRTDAELDIFEGNDEIIAYERASKFVDQMIALYDRSAAAS